MTTVDEIERAVSSLAPPELERFRAWFEESQAVRFDRRIEEDARAGRLDLLVERAREDFRRGEAREI